MTFTLYCKTTSPQTEEAYKDKDTYHWCEDILCVWRRMETRITPRRFRKRLNKHSHGEFEVTQSVVGFICVVLLKSHLY